MSVSNTGTQVAQIAEAWSHHRADRNSDAIRGFENVLNSDPDDLDALYGLGLALRATGENEKAIGAFEKALVLAKKGLKEYKPATAAETDTMEDKLLAAVGQSPRFMMLIRMLEQRLTELGKSSKA